MTQKNQSLVSHTVERLLYILTEEQAFQPGERLPNEVKLASSLNVGRSTLREAIALLKEKGILESKKGSGTYLIDMNANRTTAIDAEKGTYKLRDIMELRLQLEPGAIALAVQRGDYAEIERIVETGEELCALIAESENRIECEQSFHRQIIEATKNELFENMIPMISRSIEDAITSKQSIGKLATDTAMDVMTMVETFRQKDALAAHHAMEIHLHHIVDALNLNCGKYKLY